MKQKTLLFFTALLSLLFSTIIQAKTTGVVGAKPKYHQPVTQSHTYVVNGVTYTTKTHQSTKNYSKEGIASFYHQMFHGRKTANGEIFSNNAYTAAHKTLPMNSYVLVTNLRNGRKVVVRINDRGPFVAGRIIDLSRVAAKEIGILHSGIGRVRVEMLHVDKNGKVTTPKDNVVKVQEQSQSEQKISKEIVEKNTALATPNNAQKMHTVNYANTYRLRVLNLPSQQKAEQIIAALATQKIPAEVVANQKTYEIYFGPIKTRAELEQLKTNVKKVHSNHSMIVYSY